MITYTTYNSSFAIAALKEGLDVWLFDVEPDNDAQMFDADAIIDADGHLFLICKEV